MVKVTVFDEVGITPAAAVAASVYVRVFPLSLSFEIPVTTSASVLDKARGPLEVALDASSTESVTPVGMFVPMLAVIFLLLSFVVML